MSLPAKCKVRGCDQPWEWRHEDGAKLCDLHSRQEHEQQIRDAYDAAEEWACDDVRAAELAWQEGAS